jgi:hypothetical protein
MAYAVRLPSGKIDQKYVGPSCQDVWFERGFWLMVEKYGQEWKTEFWKRLKASKADFKKKGYSIVRVKVVKL